MKPIPSPLTARITTASVRRRWLGAGLALVVFGLVSAILASPSPPSAPSHSSADTRIALQIFADSIALATSTQATVSAPIPAPTLTTPAATTAPAPQPATASNATPCPATIHITNTGPNATTHYSCRSTAATHTGASSHVSVQSSSSQTSTGGSNSSSSTTSIVINND